MLSFLPSLLSVINIIISLALKNPSGFGGIGHSP